MKTDKNNKGILRQGMARLSVEGLQKNRSERERLFLESVIGQLPVGVLMIEAGTEKILLRNSVFDEMTQMPRIERFRDHAKFYDICRKDGTKYAIDECPIMRSISLNETITDEDLVFRRKDGKQLALSVSSTPILDKQGEVIAGLALYSDITARTMAVNHVEFLSQVGIILASSLDKKQIIERIADLIVVEICDGCAIDLLGQSGLPEMSAIRYRKPEHIQVSIKMREAGYLDTNSRLGIGMVLRTGRSALYHSIRPAVIAQLASDQRYAEVLSRSGVTSAMIVPLKEREKIIGSITFVSLDKNRLFEKSDLSLAEELAKRVSLTLENIDHYIDARNAIALRDDFITIASHELRTPLATTMTYAHLLEKSIEKEGPEKIRENLDEINGQLWNLSHLVNEMLDLSRIQGGKLNYQKAAFDLRSLVEEIVDRERKTTRDHVIITELGERSAFGDRERIGHVITNLISNAIKFSKGEIVVSTGKDGDMVRVSVKDSGIGIPREHQERVFERFHQVSKTDLKSGPGLGIGLYISSEIVKNHGGTIWVESEVGKGSTFHFTIPVAPRGAEIESSMMQMT